MNKVMFQSLSDLTGSLLWGVFYISKFFAALILVRLVAQVTSNR